jgi:hypothetical protein
LKKNKNEKKLEGTTFELELIKGLLSFLPDHMKTAIADHTISYNDLGSEKEQKLKTVLHYFSSIYSVLSDLSTTIMFLKKDRTLILEHYPNFENQKEYYTYHFENYFIRLLTLTDIIGKIGVLVYSLYIAIEKSNAYNFKEKARKEDFEKVAIITEKLIKKVNELKKERHKKLHTGVSDIETLNGIVIWSDINKIIGEQKTDKTLEDYTDLKIKEEIEGIENTINDQSQKINNLDLNEDGNVDYIKTIDNVEGNAHALILRVDLSETESQDIAVIELEKPDDNSATIQIVGDEEIYGENYIVKPIQETTTKTNMLLKTDAIIIVNVWSWPVVRFVYGPKYKPWKSPYRWNYYPVYWKPWRPYSWHTYHNFHRRHHAHYRVTHTHHVIIAHGIYKKHRRTTGVVRHHHKHHAHRKHHAHGHKGKGKHDHHGNHHGGGHHK